jgi:hypothetical protein
MASSPAAATKALFESALVTAWRKSTASIADAAGGTGKTDVRRSSDAPNRAEREENRAGRAIMLSSLAEVRSYSIMLQELQRRRISVVKQHIACRYLFI